MTLTHILPSLRRSLPDPLSRDSWPEYTTTTSDDVTIAGLSLVTLVQWCGTPCVHTAAAVIPGTNGRPSETELASIVVVRVNSATIENGQLNAHTPVRYAPELPADTRAGDLLAIPCTGVTALRDVQSRSWHPERLSDDRVDHERDNFPPTIYGK